MAVHTVYLKPTPVLGEAVGGKPAGTVLDKNTATIAEMTKANTEIRVIPDPAVPNSSGSPTMEDYLDAEAGAGFNPIVVNNTSIVTSDA
jgi:hypothetical protein